MNHSSSVRASVGRSVRLTTHPYVYQPVCGWFSACENVACFRRRLLNDPKCSYSKWHINLNSYSYSHMQIVHIHLEFCKPKGRQSRTNPHTLTHRQVHNLGFPLHMIVQDILMQRTPASMENLSEDLVSGLVFRTMKRK